MKFLGPVRVIYDGPPEQAAQLVSLARVRLGFLGATRLGFFETPMASHLTLPGGGQISVRLAGADAVATISVPRSLGGHAGSERRFMKAHGFILCAYPTSRPVQILVETVKNGVLGVDLAPTAPPDYLVVRTSVIAQGDKHTTGVLYGAAGELIFTDYMPMAAGFPPMVGTPGRVVYVPICGQTHPRTYGLAAVEPPTEPPTYTGVYTPVDGFGGENMICSAEPGSVVPDAIRGGF